MDTKAVSKDTEAASKIAVSKGDRNRVKFALVSGASVEDAQKEMAEIPPKMVANINRWLRSDPGRDWVLRHYPNSKMATELRSVALMKGSQLLHDSINPLSTVTPQTVQASAQSAPQVLEMSTSQLEDVGPEEENPSSPEVIPTPNPLPSPSITPPTGQSHVVIVKEGASGMQIIGRPGAQSPPAPQEVRSIPRALQPAIQTVGVQDEPLRMDSPPAGVRGRGTINLTPTTLLWFDYARAEGYPEDLPTFVEEAVVGFFASKGRRLVMVVDGMAGVGGGLLGQAAATMGVTG